MSKQVTVSRWFVWVFVLVLGWSLFKTFYVIPQAERRAFRIGYKQYEIYNYEQRDKYGNIGTFSKGWEDWEIDLILKARE